MNAQLGLDHGYGVLTLLDSAGKIGVIAATDPDGHSRLALVDRNGKRRILKP